MTVVVHVEPDLWGYLEQSGDTTLASSFAQQWVKLRNQLAPNVILAYHMSGWGTNHDIVYERPGDATVRAYAASSAAFYRSLRTHFDISFEDFSDRDAGFYEKIKGNAKTWFTPADFRRHLLYAHVRADMSLVHHSVLLQRFNKRTHRWHSFRAVKLTRRTAKLGSYDSFGAIRDAFPHGVIVRALITKSHGLRL